MTLLSFRLIRYLMIESTVESFVTFMVYLTREINVCNCTKIRLMEWKYDSCWVRKLGVIFVAMR